MIAQVNMAEWRQYRRKALAEMRPYQPGETLTGISISEADRLAGSPKAGDMIARNPKNHADQAGRCAILQRQLRAVMNLW